MGEMTAETFRKLYWKNYISIEEEFIQTERFVAFDICNYTTYSSAFLKLLCQLPIFVSFPIIRTVHN